MAVQQPVLSSSTSTPVMQSFIEATGDRIDVILKNWVRHEWPCASRWSPWSPCFSLFLVIYLLLFSGTLFWFSPLLRWSHGYPGLNVMQATCEWSECRRPEESRFCHWDRSKPLREVMQWPGQHSHSGKGFMAWLFSCVYVCVCVYLLTLSVTISMQPCRRHMRVLLA